MIRYCIITASLFLCLTSRAQNTPVAKTSTATPATQINAALAGTAKPQAGAAAPAVQLTEEQVSELQANITGYVDEVTGITGSIQNANSAQLKQIQQKLESVDTRWQAFSSLEQSDIASIPALMQLIAIYKQAYTSASDSLKAQMARAEAVTNFDNDVAFIEKCIPTYENFVKEAQRLSLVPQTAALLTRLKAKEQLLMQQVTTHYQQAVAAVEASPSLKEKMENLEMKYISVQEMSQQVQSAAYKSWIERAKDYIMTFAGMAIIIMFFSMVVSRISAFKKARDMAKKFGKSINGGQADIPTI